jgi:hypothetical protein
MGWSPVRANRRLRTAVALSGPLVGDQQRKKLKSRRGVQRAKSLARRGKRSKITGVLFCAVQVNNWRQVNGSWSNDELDPEVSCRYVAKLPSQMLLLLLHEVK